MTTVDSQVELAITPLTGTTGAEIPGVGLRQPLMPATRGGHTRAWRRTPVLTLGGGACAVRLVSASKATGNTPSAGGDLLSSNRRWKRGV